MQVGVGRQLQQTDTSVGGRSGASLCDPMLCAACEDQRQHLHLSRNTLPSLKAHFPPHQPCVLPHKLPHLSACAALGASRTAAQVRGNWLLPLPPRQSVMSAVVWDCVLVVLVIGQLARLQRMGVWLCTAYFTSWAYVAAMAAAWCGSHAGSGEVPVLSLTAFALSFVAGTAYWGIARDPRAPHSQVDADNALRHGGSAALLAAGMLASPASGVGVSDALPATLGAMVAFLLWSFAFKALAREWPYTVMGTPRGFGLLAAGAAALCVGGLFLGVALHG